MSIDFEKDQREDLDGANDANKLSDQVVKLQELEAELLVKEQEYKLPKYLSRYFYFFYRFIQKGSHS